jgi:hypothetical protein
VIFSQQLLNGAGLVRKTHWRLKNAVSNILNDSFRCTGRAAQQVTRFGNYRFASYQWAYQVRYGFNALHMMSFIPIK